MKATAFPFILTGKKYFCAMRGFTTFLFISSVATSITAQDFCTQVCSAVPGACAERDGSYCKGVFCHELYWKSSAKTCFSMNRDRTGQTEFPVTCSEARQFITRSAITGQSVTGTDAGVAHPQPSRATAQEAVDGAAGLPERGSRGMMNLGNTCFFNAIVQALGHSVAFRDMVLGTGDASPLSPAGVVFNELKAVFVQMWASVSRNAIDPSRLFHALLVYGGRELEDLEFFLIDGRTDPNFAKGMLLLQAVEEAIRMTTGSDEAVERAIGRTRLINKSCDTCDRRSALEFDSSFFHTVKLNGVLHGANLVDVLRETLIFDLLALCENCDKFTKHAARTHLGHTNQVHSKLIILELERYHYSGYIDTSIVIPQILDMGTVMGDENQVYRLVAVVRHDGGHYTADVYLPEGDVWIRTDDLIVEPLAGPDMIGPKPFLLLYEAM